MTESGRLDLGDNVYGHYRSIFNDCDIFGQQSKGVRQSVAFLPIHPYSAAVPSQPRLYERHWALVSESNLSKK